LVYEAVLKEELEERDYYVEKNVFWVPALARWKTLQDNAKLPAGTEITVKNGYIVRARHLSQRVASQSY
jgi:type I restriction enzyme M protein